MFESIFTGVTDIIGYFQNIWSSISGIFSDIDFTILYNWLPADIAGVITAIIAVLFILALFGLVRRLLFFLG